MGRPLRASLAEVKHRRGSADGGLGLVASEEDGQCVFRRSTLSGAAGAAHWALHAKELSQTCERHDALVKILNNAFATMTFSR